MIQILIIAYHLNTLLLNISMLCNRGYQFFCYMNRARSLLAICVRFHIYFLCYSGSGPFDGFI